MLDSQQEQRLEVTESETDLTDLTSIFYCCLSANGKQLFRWPVRFVKESNPKQ